jgi:hypothetical protein
MQFFAHLRPESAITQDFEHAKASSGQFLGVTFLRRAISNNGATPPAITYRYESDKLSTAQIAELRKHPDTVTLEAMTGTRASAHALTGHDYASETPDVL